MDEEFEYQSSREDRERLTLPEAALSYDAGPGPSLRVVHRGDEKPATAKGGGKMKTSVYLEAADVRRLSWLADVERRPQAEIIRDAIRGYLPRAADREFALFNPELPTSDQTDVTQDDIDRMMEGFGEDSIGG